MFTEASVYQSDWKKGLFNTIYQHGLTTRGWDRFRPDRAITRSEFFAVAYRAIQWADKTGGCTPEIRQICK